MMRTIDLRAGLPGNLNAVVPRAGMDITQAAAQVAPIIADVAARGAQAVLDHTERLDGVRPAHLRVTTAELQAALEQLDPAVREALAAAIQRVRAVHADQLPAPHTTTVAPGGTVTQHWLPIGRVGLYVPGGQAVYPSSVVMNVVPAQIAGVGSLVVTSPPQAQFGGRPHPTILAACALLGVSEVYAAGGAQAIAMLAHGLDLPEGGTLPAVDLITGPGNIWVTAAKRMVLGRVAIDAEAGPTEIMVLADHTADPRYVAADLISQAEHDTLAASVLVTTSADLAGEVIEAIADQVSRTKHAQRIRTALAGPQSAILLVGSLADGVAIADAYAAEHLEIHTQDAREVAMRIRNAGAIFVGPYTPVPLGDYAAGSNHVLPTAGAARHSAGLSVATFLRPVNIVEYDAAALAGIGEVVRTLAAAEDLPAHGAAIEVRR
jgi:histidinol dehydrogenase